MNQWPFLASALLHTLIVVLAITAGRKPPAPKIPASQAVWIVEAPAHGQAKSSRPAKGASKSTRNKAHLPDLRALAPIQRSGIDPSRGESKREDSASTEIGNRLSMAGEYANGRTGDAYDVANALDIKTESSLYPFFEGLWQKINAVTTYPADFVDQEISGNVVVQILVNEEGVIQKVKGIEGAEPMLNTLVVATLIHALQEALQKNRWAPEPVLLVLRFDFRLFTSGELPREVTNGHVKNVLAFRRDAYLAPKVNRVIEKFFTRYMPPIVPLPGGFFIDFPRAYQFVRNRINPTEDPDYSRKQRLDLKAKEMERMIQKGS